MTTVSINAEFRQPDCVRAVCVEQEHDGEGLLYIHFVQEDGMPACRMMTLAEFDRIAAEVATFRRLNVEAVEQERAA